MMIDCDFPAAETSDTFTLTPIGRIASDYPDKFGIPRQPGLASAARATLTLAPAFADPLTVRGLDEFSHLWLTFVFHQSPTRWTPLVRPPRLGGNAKHGVFATRSTHRPNRLGLSLVELVKIDTHHGVTLHLRGHDLVDGTPVLDIKPYLAWAEALPAARSGFAPTPPPSLPVTFSAAAEAALLMRRDGDSLRELIRQVLAQDPRPAYHKNAQNTSERRYGVRLRDVDVRCYPITTNGLDAMHVEDIIVASSPA
ncbi:tRNA (N6-threonylcarbamoyladenosine(37)-N6)-methyltransferase TrmO [Chromohalobacter sp. 48-RD10]|uniref:tRNA (N6-threonylcarbamoyladenosine(37)-N6)-methyltransferase TrmO n=1 Tax=Chromohalobacter sp. 48-RD10 TaxID=2994063 RepID=UPI002469B5AC|nr:tRNA (N6-threonylcarbamoyladenosine(37)-N6)-methyltransferase TrmO [Chromohalobacter sp. 48-RD10]